MCGLVGIFGPGAAQTGNDDFARALAAIAHRGPDGHGAYRSADGHCVLGHRRLAILDLSLAAAQPMRRNDLALVYNGEIYNHAELRTASLAGVSFSTHSDTETLLRGIETEGRPFLDACVGMFAGALYDERRRSLLLFRDELGIKPLYYRQLDDGSLHFASEIKALVALDRHWRRRTSRDLLALYLRYENLPSDTTLYPDCKILPPGARLEAKLDARGAVTWQLDGSRRELPAPATLTDADWRERTEREIERSVERHLLSDVPVGVYLSGGIDSSCVALLARRRVNDLMAFTGYFADVGETYDERPVVWEVAKKGDLELQEVQIRPRDFVETFDPLVWTLDEPRMGMGAFSQYVVAREAAKHRKVILAGHGGDELFAGYPQFGALWSLEQPLSLWRAPKAQWPWLVNAMAGRHRGGIEFAPKLYVPRGIPKNAGLDGRKAFRQTPGDSALESLRRYYRDTYLPGLLLVEDKISMAHGLETRVPLWSQPLVRTFARTPIPVLMPGGRQKGLLRQAAREWLPPAVFSAPKRGFPTPLRIWFRHTLGDFVEDRLVRKPSPVHSIVPKREVAALLRSHACVPLPFALDERRAHRIWMLLCLDSWARQNAVDLEASR